MDFSELVNHPTAGYLIGNCLYKCDIILYQRHPRNIHILTTRIGRGDDLPDIIAYFKYHKKNDYWYKVRDDGFCKCPYPNCSILSFDVTESFRRLHF